MFGVDGNCKKHRTQVDLRVTLVSQGNKGTLVKVREQLLCGK